NRLTTEIRHWDHIGNESKSKEDLGQKSRISSTQAYTRAEELGSRLQKRMNDLKLEELITPSVPIITGGAIVIPKGILVDLDHSIPNFPDVQTRKMIEELAMKKIMETEKSLGRIPKDVSGKRGLGYDIISEIPNEGKFLFIEVKGKGMDQESIVVTRNEIMTGLNKPNDFRLAIVRIDNNIAQAPVYIKEPFNKEPGFAQISATYDLKDMIDKGEEPE
ncbi:DUF3883 domain-containing protein, partial [Chloroflexi bacterium]|nr:DUF3883 domain-containing protein [Chloroflexota bacterium]